MRAEIAGTRRVAVSGREFWIWAAVHAAVWTILPTALLPNMTVDWPEHLYACGTLSFSYAKHPPLLTWIFAATEGLGLGFAGLYAAAQIAIVAAFWAVRRLALEAGLDARRAFACVFVLEAIYAYNFLSPEFNQNILILPFWAFAALAAYRAFRGDRAADWIAFGVAAGLGMLAKYTMAALLLPLAVFSWAHPAARPVWRGRGPWLALAAGAIVVLPHAIAASVSHFTPVAHALGRVSAPESGWHGPLYSWKFLCVQFGAVAPLFLIFAIAARSRSEEPPARPDAFTRSFLNACYLGPILFHAAISFAFGLRFKVNMYGAPLLLLSGLWVFSAFAPSWNAARDRVLRVAAALLAVAFAAAFALQYTWGPYLTHKAKRGQFPGRAVAEEVDRRWAEAGTGRPLPAVIGDPWIAGNAAYFSKNRPRVFTPNHYEYEDLDSHAAWLRENGGIVVWDAGKSGEGIPESSTRLFSNLRAPSSLELRPATRAPVRPFRLGLALLEPEKKP